MPSSAAGRADAGRGVRVRPFRVSYAAHSRLIDPVLPAFRQVLETVRFAAAPHRADVERDGRACRVGGDRQRRLLAHAYACTGALRTNAMQTLAAQGITHCIEIGPHPVLLGMAAECLPGSDMEWLPSLRRDRPEWSDLHREPAAALCRTAPRSTGTASTAAICAGASRSHLSVPPASALDRHCRRHASAAIATAQTRWSRDQCGTVSPGGPGSARPQRVVLPGQMGLPGAPDLRRTRFGRCATSACSAIGRRGTHAGAGARTTPESATTIGAWSGAGSMAL